MTPACALPRRFHSAASKSSRDRRTPYRTATSLMVADGPRSRRERPDAHRDRRCAHPDDHRIVDHMDVGAAVIELYGLAPEQFTPARNELARAAKDAGDPRTGEAIKALRKPTLAAWLANQLIRASPDQVNDLTELGDDLRQAQVSGDGTRLRQLTPRRHTLVQQLVKTARAQARKHGRPVSQQIAQRLTETLDAAVVDPGAAQLLRSGQLTSALRHVGFGVVDETGGLAELAPIKPRVVRSRPKPPAAKKTARPPRRAASVDDSLQRRRAELQSRAQEAEDDYATAQAERVEAEAQLDAHEHHIADLEAASSGSLRSSNTPARHCATPTAAPGVSRSNWPAPPGTRRSLSAAATRSSKDSATSTPDPRNHQLAARCCGSIEPRAFPREVAGTDEARRRRRPRPPRDGLVEHGDRRG
ncbi:hypothetical protein ACIBL3_40505 [Kribbella sp. NPDC050124]|uniref:hypothetical protein n=1 Tax=Kribbella sp. NPDC050124 TaxID=3364114 RepID=UPI0037A24C77